MWKYVFSSVAGSYHDRTSLPGQDACGVEVIFDTGGNEVLIAVASDGAGTAIKGHIGSRIACDLFIEEVKSHFARSRDCVQLADGFIEDWIVKFQHLISVSSNESSLDPQDFACTLLASVVGSNHAAFFQIGDGAIVASHSEERDSYQCVCWPQQGEYANTTNFLTDAGAEEKIFRKLQSGSIDEVAIFTDGIQSLVLNYHTRSAHSPFFSALFKWLRPRSSSHSHELSDSLKVYLNSEKFNMRTDDDRTLVLATRR
jgi:hypothetical protein